MSLKKKDEKGYGDFSDVEIPKDFFSKKQEIDEEQEPEEKTFWAELLGILILAIIGMGALIFYGIHGIKELWKELVNFFNF
jgi:hypothetical protein